MHTRKWRKYYASKYRFPTYELGGGNVSGALVIGHKAALKHVEKQLGRRLRDPKVVTKGGNWCFMEPKGWQAWANMPTA